MRTEARKLKWRRLKQSGAPRSDRPIRRQLLRIAANERRGKCGPARLESQLVHRVFVNFLLEYMIKASLFLCPLLQPFREKLLHGCLVQKFFTVFNGLLYRIFI